MYRLFVFLFAILSCSTIPAQQNEFNSRSFTTENGLPSNGIKGLQWDEQSGFLWIATEAGVSRFNGLDFKNFTQENIPTITSERMVFMVRNNAGRIYTSDQKGNLHFINKNKIDYFDKITLPPQGFYDNRFTITISDQFFTKSKQVSNPIPVSFLYSQFLPISDTACFIYHGNNIFWFSASSKTMIPYGDQLNVQNCFKIGDRFFYLSEDSRLYEMYGDYRKNKVVAFSDDAIALSALFKKGDLYWNNGMGNPIVINRGKAWKLTLVGDTIVPILICTAVPVDALIGYVQYSEKLHTLFIGTDSKGIFVISQNRMKSVREIKGHPNERNSYYAQIELDNGNVLTGEGHVVGENLNPLSSLPIQGKFSNHVSTTGDSLIWYSRIVPPSGFHNLYQYDKRTRLTKVYPKINAGEIIVHPLRDGRILMVTEFGIGYLANDSIQYQYRHPAPDYYYNSSIYGIAQIQEDLFLVASCSGILQYNLRSNTMDTVLKTEGTCIRSLWQFKDYVFFGSYGKGVFAWKNGKLKSMPLDKQRYLLYAHCFIPDGEGGCWISSNRGLFKASISELIHAYDNDKATVYYHYYGKKDGMDMNEMNGGCTPCALELKNKTISFPTMDGLLWVDPKKAAPILPDGEIFIDEIIAGNNNVITANTDTEIQLPARTKDLSVYLSFAAWCNKENIYLEYQLNDSVNWKPVNTDNKNVVHFNNLPPGNYVLRFRKLNGFGIENYAYKVIRFNIITPWYKKLWFNLLVVLILIGLVLLYVQGRTGQLKRKQLRLQQMIDEKTKELQEQNEVLEKNNSIKTRLISIISHDIVTPLKFLTVAGKNLLKQREIMPEALQQETIREMTNTSQELQLLSTNILNWIKYQNENRRLTKETFNMHEMVSQVLGILNSLAQQKNLRIVNAIDKDVTIYQFYEPMKILVYNMLTNAIHFSEKGIITVRVEENDNNTIVSVQDEGVGMTAEKKQSLMEDHIVISSANVDNRKGHGLGFLIIKDLLKMMDATINIKSEVGEGSTISIIFPS